MNRNLQLLVISLFIIGFPLGSWYYLNKGYDYRMAIISELDQQLGKIPVFQLMNQKGKKLSEKDIEKKVVVVNFIAIQHIDEQKANMKKLYKIQDQFDKKDDILFFTFVKADSLPLVQAYAKSLNIKEEKQWHFLTGTDAEMTQLIQAFPLPDNTEKVYAGNSTVAIADTSSIIRYFYDITDSKQAGKLVEHIANLMPQAPPEKARMKRELEK